MNLFLDKYRSNNYEYIKKLLQRDIESGKNVRDTISLVSATIHLPILVGLSFAKEILNTNIFDGDIESLKQFYHCEGIYEKE